MTVTAVEARKTRPRRRNSRTARGEKLVPFAEASVTLAKSPDTLRQYHDDGHLPAVVSPGGQWSTYQSFIDAVLASARPRRAGDFAAIAADWFAARNATQIPEVA